MASKKILDFRSDTVTKPGPAMREAMAKAEVGDDVYGEDPTVNLLEATAAELLGKQAGLFLPSGTMGNLIAVLNHCRDRGVEVILGKESHTYFYEVGGGSALGGVAFCPLQEDSQGKLTPGQIEAAIRPQNIHFPRTALLCLENTHNRSGGTVMAPEYVKTLTDVAHKRGIPVHLDGARLFNAAAALKVPVKDLVAECDSVQFCLSKGLGAPVGSILVGTTDFIKGARSLRKMLGGGMRQAGVLAAAGLIALTEMPKRLQEDHDNCRHLAEGLAKIAGITLELSTVQTNMVYADVAGTGITAADFAAKLKARGLLLNATSATRVRFVTHLDVNRADIDEGLKIVQEVVQAK